jgi:site-specific DNA-methyltransferase (adenine-specific)
MHVEDQVCVYNGDVADLYEEWSDPEVIVSDGAYGVSGFEGDTDTADELPEWYEHHVRAWSKEAPAGTTLWFWNTELGWANMHPTLESHGWEYKRCNIWHKGIGHIAGNSNTQRAQTFPAVTEVCVHYVKRPTFESENGEEFSLQEWLRHEWKRSGLNFNEANEACGVADAATRKYLTPGHLWYAPPVEAFGKLVEYANTEGDEEGKPYFSVDGERPITRKEYNDMFPKFDCEVGKTNVWDCPPLRSKERIRGENRTKALHLNQKPLELIDLIIEASTDPGDVVWEPFGGLCTAAVSAKKLGRRALAAEVNDYVYKKAVERVAATTKDEEVDVPDLDMSTSSGVAEPSLFDERHYS